MISFKFLLSLAMTTLYLSLPVFAQQKPNIVLIMTDDVSWEAFESYGSTEYLTPNLSQLAAKGVQFQHAYSTPICTTSRVMLMTGKQNFRNYTHFGYLNPDEKTFGNLMQNAGYKTAIAGKWQLNGITSGDTFADRYDEKRPHKAGFDEYALWQLVVDKVSPKGNNIKEATERFWSPVLEINSKITTAEDNAGLYGPDIMSEFLLNFIDKYQNEPFFIYYPMVLVHAPFVPTPDTIGNGDRSQAANKISKDRAENKKNFQAMVAYTDKIVGKIVQKLEDINQLNNTLILFTSDNGTSSGITSTWQGQKIRGGKGRMLDMGTHVPLIAYWQGKTAKGVKNNDLIDFTDFYPTIAEAAGITLGNSDPKDGRSFLPQLFGKKGNPRKTLYSHYQPYKGTNKKVTKGGIFARTQDYKLYSSGKLVNVSNDLIEKKDLAKLNTPELIQVTKQLEAVLQQLPALPKNGKAQSMEARILHPKWQQIQVD
ncbi:sulfatase-like hydrolase/transferase [Thalassotalea sp. PLHSN55]|uniref:sulfatase-like hydrolase/transferase n=1 Tax=Thalassotalea sp. PLHSN55 TaxID=3435888 RepID=UPI003F843CEF